MMYMYIVLLHIYIPYLCAIKMKNIFVTEIYISFFRETILVKDVTLIPPNLQNTID